LSGHYDVIFDASAKIPGSRCKGLLKKDGVFLSVKSLTSEKTEYLKELRELIETGKLRAAVDRSFPLENTAEAHRYVDQGRKKGIVVITVVPDGKS
jgi:NADPH:quinone reductase-like Zn-dependent oxidoreductase